MFSPKHFRNSPGVGLKHEFLPEGYDIDTADDLGRLQSERSRRDVLMKNTFALLNRLKQRGKLLI